MASSRVFTGANGTLMLANEDTPEGADASRVIEAFDIQTVGRVTGVTVRIDTQLEEFHEIGRRHAASLHAGNIHISGTVGRAYVNPALVYLLMGQGARPTQVPEPYVQPAFTMTLSVNDPAVPGVTTGMELRNVHFQDWSFDMPEDDFVMENVAFKALAISVFHREAPSGGGEAVALVPEFGEAEA